MITLAWLDNINLEWLHNALCVIGIWCCVWCHQLWGRNILATEAIPFVKVTQRVAFVLLALGLCYSLSYVLATHWAPWPPQIIVLAALDLYLLSILLAAHDKERRQQDHGSRKISA